MLIKDILEKSYETKMDDIAKELPVGEKRVRDILKAIDCKPNGVGKKGWSYIGADPSVLDKDFTDFIPHTAVKTQKERKKKTSNNEIKEPLKPVKNDIMISEQPIKTEIIEPSKNEINQPSNVTRKRTSFDLDTNLLKQLKLRAVMEERNLYELVEEAIKEYLKK